MGLLNKKLEMAISKLNIEFEALSLYPFTWDIVESDKVPTMGTDYKRLLYNPQFVESLEVKQIVSVLIHEIFHCVFLHPSAVDRNISRDKDPFVWDIALEQVTNAETISIIEGKDYQLPHNPVDPISVVKGEMSQGYIYSPKFKNMDSITIYNELIKYYNPGKVSANGNSKLILVSDIIEAEKSSDIMQDATEKAIATIKKMLKQGNISANLDRHLKDLTTSKIPWTRILYNFTSKITEGHDELSFCKPNTRHPLIDVIVIPDTFSRDIDFGVVVVDTSGSIDNKTLSEFVSGIATLKNITENLLIITTDTKVHEMVKVSSVGEILRKIKFKGGGGTDFKDVFKRIKKCEFMIFFTDGCASYPQKAPHYPVLWILTNEHVKPPFGKVAYILEK